MDSGLFFAPFWILIGIFFLLAIISIFVRGFSFVDFQLIVAMIAISFFFDMVFCKWLNYYSYVVSDERKAFYSLIFCVIGYPSLGIIFIKFVPSTLGRVIFYILLWSAALTITEIAFAEPYSIVTYEKWHIIPYSPIIYIISLVWEYGYYRVMKKHLNKRYI